MPLGIVAVLALALVGATLADAALARRRPEAVVTLPTLIARGVPSALTLTILPRQGGVRSRLRQATPPDIELSPAEGDDGVSAQLVAWRRGRHVLPAPAVRRSLALTGQRVYTKSGIVLLTYDLIRPTAKRKRSQAK